MIYCARCANKRWVCKAHTDRPWAGTIGCPCGAPGSPCPVCNKVDAEIEPDMPDDFVAQTQRQFHPLVEINPDHESLGDALARSAERATERKRSLH